MNPTSSNPNSLYLTEECQYLKTNANILTSTVKVNGKPIDHLAQTILVHLADSPDGAMNTSQIKRVTGVKANYKIHHRYGNLEAAGLITLDSEAIELDNGLQSSVKVASITPDGQRIVQNGDLDPEPETLKEHIDALEAHINHLEVRVDELEQENKQMQQVVDGVDDYFFSELSIDLREYDDFDF